MAAEIPTTEPTEIIAGDTLAWYREVTDYSAADGWTLTYYLRGPSAISISATQDGTTSRFAVSVAKTTTVNYAPGDYQWQAYVSKAAERYKVDEGEVTIAENWELLTGAKEIRSKAKQILDALIDLQLRRATRPELGYSVQAAGRSFNFKTDEQIQKAIDYWSAKVAEEERVATGDFAKNIFVRFN